MFKEVSISISDNGQKRSLRGFQSYGTFTDNLSTQGFFEQLREVLIMTAYQTLAEEQRKGFDKDPKVVVDGRFNRPVEAVNPAGEIRFVAAVQITQPLMELYEALEIRSPQDTGQYRGANFVMVNSQFVARDPASFKKFLDSNKLQPGDTIKFINLAPYARWLERRGVTAQRVRYRTQKSRDKQRRSGERVLAPNGVYFLSFRSFKSKWGRNFPVYFGFTKMRTKGILSFYRKGGGAALRDTFKRTGEPYLYPTITVIFGAKGGIS